MNAPLITHFHGQKNTIKLIKYRYLAYTIICLQFTSVPWPLPLLTNTLLHPYSIILCSIYLFSLLRRSPKETQLLPQVCSTDITRGRSFESIMHFCYCFSLRFYLTSNNNHLLASRLLSNCHSPEGFIFLIKDNRALTFIKTINKIMDVELEN